jgi:hypothetical protein
MWNIVIPLHSLLSVFIVFKLLHFTETTEAKLGRNVHWIKITKFMFLFWLEIHHRNNRFHHRNKRRSQGDMFSCTSVKCLFLLWTIEEISIFSNSSHLEWRAELSDTILKWDYPRTIPAKSGLIWYSGFRGEDLNVIFYTSVKCLFLLCFVF